jgi:hypothetical protein
MLRMGILFKSHINLDLTVILKDTSPLEKQKSFLYPYSFIFTLKNI